MKLTVAILAKNEEDTIQRAIESAKFADEILLIDDASSDKTVQVAKHIGAKVVEKKMGEGFGAQRNYAMNQATYDWVLFLDADEQISKQLEHKLYNVLDHAEQKAFYIKRKDVWWGKTLKHGEVQDVYTRGIIRLVKKGSGKWEGMVHETFVPSGSIGRIDAFINHYPHPNMKDFLRVINFYSTLRAQELQKKGKKVGIFGILFYPFLKFFYTYFILFGFMDGPAGFAYSFLMSFHSFLARAKLYQYTELDRR